MKKVHAVTGALVMLAVIQMGACSSATTNQTNKQTTNQTTENTPESEELSNLKTVETVTLPVTGE
jgi:hypothetical protein